MLTFSIVQGLVSLRCCYDDGSLPYPRDSKVIQASSKRGNCKARLLVCHWHGVLALGICFLALELYQFRVVGGLSIDPLS